VADPRWLGAVEGIVTLVGVGCDKEIVEIVLGGLMTCTPGLILTSVTSQECPSAPAGSLVWGWTRGDDGEL